MREKKEKVLKDTAEFWEKRTGRKVSEMEAEDIVNNISGFFRVLAEWERKGKQVDDSLDTHKKQT